MAYSEADIIVPTLTLLAEQGDEGLTTSELIAVLQATLDLSDDDKKILKNRKDTHFSQIVRNLVSHNTLVRKGFATYDGQQRPARHRITTTGRAYLGENAEGYAYIMGSGFTAKQRETVIENDFKNLVIEEGYLMPVSKSEKRKRSRLLTKLAREHYAKDGTIHCHGCNFAFNAFYGTSAKGYIEIHHLKPISTYDQNNVTKSLVTALEDVRPLCANCHRMIHRDPSHVLSIAELRQLVSDNGHFDISAS